MNIQKLVVHHSSDKECLTDEPDLKRHADKTQEEKENYTINFQKQDEKICHRLKHRKDFLITQDIIEETVKKSFPKRKTFEIYKYALNLKMKTNEIYECFQQVSLLISQAQSALVRDVNLNKERTSALKEYGNIPANLCKIVDLAKGQDFFAVNDKKQIYQVSTSNGTKTPDCTCTPKKSGCGCDDQNSKLECTCTDCKCQPCLLKDNNATGTAENICPATGGPCPGSGGSSSGGADSTKICPTTQGPCPNAKLGLKGGAPGGGGSDLCPATGQVCKSGNAATSTSSDICPATGQVCSQGSQTAGGAGGGKKVCPSTGKECPNAKGSTADSGNICPSLGTICPSAAQSKTTVGTVGTTDSSFCPSTGSRCPSDKSALTKLLCPSSGTICKSVEITNINCSDKPSGNTDEDLTLCACGQGAENKKPHELGPCMCDKDKKSCPCDDKKKPSASADDCVCDSKKENTKNPDDCSCFPAKTPPPPPPAASTDICEAPCGQSAQTPAPQPDNCGCPVTEKTDDCTCWSGDAAGKEPCLCTEEGDNPCICGGKGKGPKKPGKGKGNGKGENGKNGDKNKGPCKKVCRLCLPCCDCKVCPNKPDDPMLDPAYRDKLRREKMAKKNGTNGEKGGKDGNGKGKNGKKPESGGGKGGGGKGSGGKNGKNGKGSAGNGKAGGSSFTCDPSCDEESKKNTNYKCDPTCGGGKPQGANCCCKPCKCATCSLKALNEELECMRKQLRELKKST